MTFYECFLIDIVGKVENIQGIIRSKKNEHETIRKKFDISDGRLEICIRNILYYICFHSYIMILIFKTITGLELM